MRAIMLAILLLLLPLCRVHAQVLFGQEDDRIFYGSLESGANFSQVDGDGFSGYHKVGIAGVASVLVKPFSLLGISLGIGYEQKGSLEKSIQEFNTVPALFEYRLHFQYASLPLLVHLFLPGRLYYSAGVSYNRLISADESADANFPIKISPDLYPFKKQDWCGIAGITYRIGKGFFIAGQYQYTVGSIRSDPFIPPGFGAGLGRERNNVMSLRIRYIIASAGTR